MSNTKTVMGQASNQYVAPTDITDVFSTYLYAGTGAANTITNGIDLAGEGGMVWIKVRDWSSGYPSVHDTERGATKRLTTNTTDAESTRSGAVTAFNSDGFSVGSFGYENLVNGNVASWTFRKAPKFFDVVTYTGDGVAGREIAHNLGSTPAVIITKNLNDTENWQVYHKDLGNDQRILLNATAPVYPSSAHWNNTTPTSTVFTVGTHNGTNGSGDGIVAYLFAHNDGDGGFGPASDQDIIKCGSYTGNGSTNGPEIDLGFEPQWVMVKAASATGNWHMFDTMRGIPTGGNDPWLNADESSVENPNSPALDVTATGFKLADNSAGWNGSSVNYIYMAIRRGPLAPPTAGTEVFAIDTQAASSAPFLTSNFPVDMVIRKRTTGSNSEVMSRLTQGKGLFANATSAEQTDSVAQFDFNDGCLDNTSTDTNRYGWMWKRAPGYFDVVAYTADGTTVNINHNLGSEPEMIWVKRRNSSDVYAAFWSVYHKDIGYDKVLKLNGTDAPLTYSGYWGSGNTNTTFGVSTSFNPVNTSGNTYIAYLFASLPGISKVGSYTGNGSSQTIDCGFTSGARFVLIKRTDSTGGWFVFDTERGIVSGNDPRLKLDSTAAESSADDCIDPNSSGFIVNQTSFANVNVSTGSYIFYAIA